jgi:signal peptidase I
MNSTANSVFGPAAALQCELASEVLRSTGHLRMQVTGWSMLPAIWPGDTLLVERTNSDSVSRGDVVLVGRNRRLFVHRVIKKANSFEQIPKVRIVTQGDAMPRPDPPCSQAELLGKVSFVMRNGRLIEPSKTPGVGNRLVSSLVRRSRSAARMIVGLHGLRFAARGKNSQRPSLGAVEPCRN